MPSLLNNVRHWQERAEEARAVAGQLSDAEARRVMLGIADGYQRLAKLAEARNGQLAASSGKARLEAAAKPVAGRRDA